MVRDCLILGLVLLGVFYCWVIIVVVPLAKILWQSFHTVGFFFIVGLLVSKLFVCCVNGLELFVCRVIIGIVSLLGFLIS
jgi:hypothetical protein